MDTEADKEHLPAQAGDHKKLGKELDLLLSPTSWVRVFLCGPPKGTTLLTLIDDFVWELRRKYGYEKVEIPHITKREL